MKNAHEKKLEQIRVAIAAKRLELLREIPARYEYENPREFLIAFCVANHLPSLYAATPADRVELLRQLPGLLGYKHLEDLIAALSTAHGRTPGRRILTPEKIERLIELSARGVPTQTIADTLGCAKQTVANVRYELGISRKQKGKAKNGAAV